VSGAPDRGEAAVPTFGVFYDFCNPAPWRRPWGERYAQLIEQIDWVERTPEFGAVSLSEHHFLDDGYCPSVLGLAAAVASRTSRIEVMTNIVQLPLHHPLRVAEEALTIDIISDRRFRLGVANGYREQEFLALGTSTRDRATRTEEAMTILRLAFAGEPFSHAGRHWSFPEVMVTPPPVRDGGPPIWMGGSADAAIERTARLADGFLSSTDADVERYAATCERLGVPAERRHAENTAWVIVDPDPEACLRRVGPHILYQVNQYVEYGVLPGPPFEDPAKLVEQGFYSFVDADGAIELFRRSAATGAEEIHLFGALPGEPVEQGSARLEYVAREVIPALAGDPNPTERS
jgi:alkanesulfonate monooxygenase SsuD/methylene tetrahydromethanopterin reductase-like flavin-dependent oxidoreductase (luciferase family)